MNERVNDAPYIAQPKADIVNSTNLESIIYEEPMLVKFESVLIKSTTALISICTFYIEIENKVSGRVISTSTWLNSL